MLTPCPDRHPPESHHYWPQIRDDGAANVWKCGRCGCIVAWDVGDEAQAYVEGDKLLREQHLRLKDAQ